jgi:hypothetical protein
MDVPSKETAIREEAPPSSLSQLLPGARLRVAEAALETAYPADTPTLVSFLVNALYLFGGQSVAAWEGAPEGVTAELTRLGHRVRTGPSAREGGNAGHDRIFLAEAFGRGGDGELLQRLRALRRALRPGGLLCFHVFDRDRAWERARERTVSVDGSEMRVRIDFDPANGRLMARAEKGPAAGVKAWNLGEMRALLRASGLVLERAYGDWAGGSPGAAASGRLIVVAAKPLAARRHPRPRAPSAAKRLS